MLNVTYICSDGNKMVSSSRFKVSFLFVEQQIQSGPIFSIQNHPEITPISPLSQTLKGIRKDYSNAIMGGTKWRIFIGVQIQSMRPLLGFSSIQVGKSIKSQKVTISHIFHTILTLSCKIKYNQFLFLCTKMWSTIFLQIFCAYFFGGLAIFAHI